MYFSHDRHNLKGAYMGHELGQFKEYSRAYAALSECEGYASAYADAMLEKAKDEDNDLYADRGLSHDEMVEHLVNTMCLPYRKAHASQFRQSKADQMSKHYLNDTIRRAINGGDKFNPYM
eukprot:CAMPEP_0170491980 /NCGR_PEP_ID=MMETSP0208-20121228/11465_1 /TAXON_ID=197538 /ORGANISM="Strombidium inclinatum, Strain S3" /LENGTH=119 /DNA_ID=CAMNT_0010767645 /DNA_START=30 /DNA_END=389 /DNA_ORIENTATION=+